MQPYVPTEIHQLLTGGAHLIVSVSGGKDSDCQAIELARLRATHGWPGRLIFMHADVGRMEWRQSLPHCRRQAEHLGAEFVVVEHARYDLLGGIHNRLQTRADAPPFPSSAARYCTAGWKRDPMSKWMRNHIPDGEIAVCAIGLRREESPARAKKPYFAERTGASAPSKRRRVVDWYPILDYSQADVWRVLGYTLAELADIRARVQQFRANGHTTDETLRFVETLRFTAHPAYALGNDRVSCTLCVLANRNDLANGAEFNPEIAGALAALERASGYTFTQKIAMARLIEQLPPPAAARARSAMAAAQLAAPAKPKSSAVGTTGDLFAGLEMAVA